MSELVVGNGKRFGLARDQSFSKRSRSNAQETGLSKNLVDVNGAADRGQPILGYNDDGGADLFRCIDNRSRTSVDFGNTIGVMLGQSLKVIVEVGQIGQC